MSKIIVKNENENENEVTDEEGESYKDFIKEYSNLHEKYKQGQITMKEYYDGYYKLMDPYKPKDTINEGYTEILKTNGKQYIHNLNKYRNSGPVFTYENILDENGKLVDIKKKLLVNGETRNIIGFMIYPMGSIKNVDDLKLVGKITNYNNNIITIKNHGLKSETDLQIIDSYVKPSLDGKYKIKVLNKDEIQLLDVDAKTIEEKTNFGIAYVQPKLNYKMSKIIKKDNKYVIENEHQSPETKMLLFDNVINKKELKSILNDITPTLDNIIGNNYELIKDFIKLEDLNTILIGYGLSIDNLDDFQYKYLNTLLQKNKTDFIKNLYHHNFSKEKVDNFKKLYEDDNFLFANKYIQNKNIIKQFGEYPLFNTPYDNPFLRYSWVVSNNEDYYLINVNLIRNESLDTKQIKANIEDKLQYYEKEKTNLQNKIDEINEKQKYFNVNNECIKMNYNVIEHINEDVDIQELLEKENKEKPVLITNKGETKIYKYDTKDNEWKFEKASNYKKIEYLCNYKDINLEDLDYDQLDCLYKKSYGCHSRYYVKLRNQFDKIDVIVNNLKELMDTIDDKKKIITENLVISEKFIYKKNYVKEEEEEEKKEIEPKKEKNEYSKYHEYIENLDNDYFRNYVIYKLIENDGLLIDNQIYSKKYGYKTFCGHYYFQKKIEEESNLEIKLRLQEMMNAIYIDGEMVDNSYKTCKICGQNIGTKIEDEFLGFDSATGAYKLQSEVWYAKTEEEEKLQSELEYLYTKETEIDCNDKKFIDNILTHGIKKGDKVIKIDNINKIISLCNIVKKISNPMGFRLLNEDIVDILYDSFVYVQSLPDYRNFVRKEEQKLMKRGITQERIQKLREMESFKNSYVEYINFMKYIYVSIRILITLQTAVPSYHRINQETVCTFNGIQGKEGIDYLVCILLKLNIYNAKDKKRDESKESFIREILWSEYKKISNYKYIQELFDKKKMNLKKIRKPLYLKDSNEIAAKSVKNIKISNEDPVKNNKLFDELYQKNKYLSNEIIKIVNKITKEAYLEQDLVKIPETSCCNELIDEYVNYYNYFMEKEDGKDLVELLEQSHKYTEMFNKKLNNGVYSRVKIVSDRNLAINNEAILNSYNDVSESSIKDKFLVYCHNGIRPGERHSFIKDYGDENKSRCVKCGLYYGDLKSRSYSMGDYHELLKKIENITEKRIEIKSRNYNKDIEQSIELMDKMDSLGETVDNLAHLITIVLNKDNTFKENLKEQLISMGVFKESNSKERLSRVKNIYNNYFRYYISIIANHYDKKEIKSELKMEGVSDEIGKELQKQEVQYWDSFDRFYEHSDLFKKMKFEHSFGFINDIYGKEDVIINGEIKYRSKFTNTNASELVLNLLYQQLILFIKSDNTKLEESKKSQIIVEFIMTLMDKINDNNGFLEISKQQASNFEKLINEKVRKSRENKIGTLDGLAKLLFFQKGNNIDFEEDMEDDAYQYNENMEFLKEKAKETLGENATQEEIETYAEDRMQDILQEEEIFEDNFSFMGQKEGQEVLDVGDRYDEDPQGTENAGDGYVDDFVDIIIKNE